MVVVRADRFNRSGIQTVVVAAITSTIGLADASGNVLIGRRESGLEKESVVNVSQLLTVEKKWLLERIRTLPSRTMTRIDDGLRLVLDL